MPTKKETIVDRFLQMIAEICAAGQMTTKEFVSENTCISAPSISHLKNGRLSMIGADVAAEICQKYNYSVEWLLLGKGEKKTDKQTRSIEKEIGHIKELLGELVVPLVNEILKSGKKPKNIAISELLANFKSN